MSIFRRVAERGRAYAQSASGGSLSFGGSLAGGVEGGGQRMLVNGVPLHVPEIWSRYDEVAEFHFDANFLAACLSLCTLRLGVRDKENRIGPAFDENGKPLEGVPSTLAKLGAKMIAGLRSAPSDGQNLGAVGGHGLLLGRSGANLLPTGECYWVATKTPMGDHWEVLSTMELQPLATPPGEKQKFRRRRFRGAPWEEFVPNFYLRIHKSHPAWSGEADTSALALLPTLERIALLNAEGVADSKSRLKGPGVLFVPTEADFPTTDADPTGDRYLTNEFIDTAKIAIRDPSNASAHIPLVIGMQGERIEQVQHLRFDYNDSALIEKRTAAVGDMARGVPLPYETTIGMSDTSFANAFAVEGQLARIFVPDFLNLITGCLTAGWLTKGLMVATGQPTNQPPSEDIQRFVVWHDVSDLVTDPDPTKVAQWAYGTDTNPNSLISAQGARFMVSIPEQFRPSPEETKSRAERAQKLRARAEQGGATPSNNPDTTPPDGKPKSDQGDGKRDKDAEVGKRVLSLADTMVTMAVDVAGNKLRGKCAGRSDLKAKIDGVNPADVPRTLGWGTIESLGGTDPLFNGQFAAFGRTVTDLFVEAGREDAADLADAAVKMAKQVAIARLLNPSAQIDVRMAAGFLDLLNSH